MSTVLILADGSCTISRDRPPIPIGIYASQTSSWFGQVIQRSDDGGKTWNPPGTKPEDLMGPDGMPKGESNMFLYDASAETGPTAHDAPALRRFTASVGI